MRINPKAIVLLFFFAAGLSFPRSVLSDVEPGPAKQKEPLKVAIMPFDYISNSANKDVAKGRIVSDIFTTSAVKSGVFNVVEREQISKVLEEMEFGKQGKTYTSEVQKIGDLVGANIVLTGSVTELDASIRIAARMIDVGSGRIIAAEDSFSQNSLQSMATACDSVMKRIVAAIYPRAQKEQPAPTEDKPSESISSQRAAPSHETPAGTAPAGSDKKWLVIFGTFPKDSLAKAKERLAIVRGLGHDARIEGTEQFPNLRPNLLIVVSGPFSKDSAKELLRGSERRLPEEAYIKSGW